MIWNLIGTIGGKVLDIVDDKDAANKLKFHIQKQKVNLRTLGNRVEPNPKAYIFRLTHPKLIDNV